MKKIIKFADDLSKLILAGERTSTWRLFDDKDLQSGDEVDFVNKQTMQKFGEATLLEVKEKSLGSLEEEDWVGHEKFPDTETMYLTYEKYYPNEEVNENTMVKIIKFEFIPLENIAFIDGQNLYFSGKEAGLHLDLKRFRVYLKEKYKVDKAYYYLGSIFDKHQDLYDEIQSAGFVLKFREHGLEQTSNKKGNVDTDIVFEMMRNFIKNTSLNKIVLVSGDGDYFKAVKFLVEENKFEKILFPSKKSSSSLYKILRTKYYDFLDSEIIRSKICKIK